jgi:hypothetical protein
VLDAGGKVLCVSNPLRIAEPPLPECRAMVDGGASANHIEQRLSLSLNVRLE